MKQNIHNVERVVRVILGLIVLSLVFVGPKSLWGLLGLLPIATGLIGWCFVGLQDGKRRAIESPLIDCGCI